MAKTFKPFAYIDNRRTVEFMEFATYVEFKKQIKDLLKNNINDITVFRHRRGEWGEWFEKWELRNGKPVIYKQGWC
jgi:hypothetical protein